MAELPTRNRMTKMALYVSVFVFFAVGAGVGQVKAAGCGDYLHHSAKRVFSDPSKDSQPTPGCKGGNCRSAPSLPPVEPSRVVVSHKQTLGFRPAEADFTCSKSHSIEFFDDILPLSATLEVITPPPIFAA